MSVWETRVGVHILSDYGEKYSFVSSEVSERTICKALNGVDWVHGFHQVVVVRDGGESMEVGGSLEEGVGLAAVYRVTPDRVSAVIVDPPETVDEMLGILIAFSHGGDAWREKYEFD